LTLKFAGHCQLSSRDAFRRNLDYNLSSNKDIKDLGTHGHSDMLSHSYMDDLSLVDDGRKDKKRRHV